MSFQSFKCCRTLRIFAILPGGDPEGFLVLSPYPYDIGKDHGRFSILVSQKGQDFTDVAPLHVVGIIEKAHCPVHITPFCAERIVFQTDGLRYRCHDQIPAKRAKRRFCIDITSGWFSTSKMIAMELNGLPDLPVGNVFPGEGILQE